MNDLDGALQLSPTAWWQTYNVLFVSSLSIYPPVLSLLSYLSYPGGTVQPLRAAVLLLSPLDHFPAVVVGRHARRRAAVRKLRDGNICGPCSYSVEAVSAHL